MDSHAALAYLERPEARRLVAAWPIVGRKRPRNPSVTLDSEWARAADVRVATAETLGRSLRDVGICQDGGKIDPVAVAFISNAAANSTGVRLKKK